MHLLRGSVCRVAKGRVSLATCSRSYPPPRVIAPRRISETPKLTHWLSEQVLEDPHRELGKGGLCKKEPARFR